VPLFKARSEGDPRSPLENVARDPVLGPFWGEGVNASRWGQYGGERGEGEKKWGEAKGRSTDSYGQDKKKKGHGKDPPKTNREEARTETSGRGEEKQLQPISSEWIRLPSRRFKKSQSIGLKGS